jgi:hypothetical protein
MFKVPKIKIKEDFKTQEEKGSYNPLSHNITFYQKSSHTLLLELRPHITVSVLHLAGSITEKYAKNEILAELVAYVLLKKFVEMSITISRIATYRQAE